MPAERTTSPRSGRRHPASGPLVFDTRDLGRQAGSMQQLRTSVPAPEPIALELIGVHAGTPLDLDVRFEAVAEGVLLSGTVDTAAEGECGRCLDPVRLPISLWLTELFAYPGSATDETTDTDELYRVQDDRVDFAPVLRDALVLALPLTPLCSADCPGLCPGCGAKWDDLPDDHTHEVIDPRWAALQAMLTDPPAVRSDDDAGPGSGSAPPHD